MSKTTFTFGKISATPTHNEWSQAYNAGALFVVLSLSLDGEKESEPLAGIGKGFLNELEAEFFTLESKDLSGITQALENVLENVPKQVTLTTLVAFIKEQTLYLHLVGDGSIIMKRNDKIGTLLSSQETTRTIQSASGLLLPNDCLILTTNSFRKLVTDEKITAALSLPDTEEMTETLTPHIHKTEEGSACAIVFKAEGETHETPAVVTEKKDPSQTEPIVDKPQQETIQESPEEMSYTSSESEHTRPFQQPASANEKPPMSAKIPSLSQFTLFSNLSHRKKVFLSIAGVLIVIFIASIFFTISNQQATARRELFNEIYPEAEKNYEEAEGIVSLNKIQARRELEEAQKLLAQTEGKFPSSSEEYKKTENLLSRIEALLAKLGDSVEVEATKIADSENLLLASLKPSDRIAVVEDETSIYFLTRDEIGSIRKGSKSETDLVTNNDDWEKPVGLGKFGSNFYVLDQTNGILKLVPRGSDYSVSDYLTEEVSMSDASSMAIDSSIYVLFDTGDIKKFTRGKEESFDIKGLDTPLSSPTQIVTSEDLDSLFVLDPKASRIVKLSKSGSVEEEYLSQVITDAKGFSVSSDGNTAYVLTEDTIYSLSL